MRKCYYIVVYACNNITEKIICQNVWPANSALFICVSTHCVETVKQLDYNRFSELTRWCRCYASDLGARGPGFNSRLRQGFLWVLLFFLLFCCFCCFCCCCYCWCSVLLFVQIHIYLSQNCAIPLHLFRIHISMFVTNYKGIQIQTQHI